MVDIQKTQEWIDLIRPWDDIRNVGYTSRRINQKMQVMNTYLDWDMANSFDNIYNDEEMIVSHLQHEITWNYDFWEVWQSGIKVPLDWTYIITCVVDVMLIENNEAVYVWVVKNWSGAVLNMRYISDRVDAQYTLRWTEIVNLQKWDILTVSVTAISLVSWVSLDYPKDVITHINLVKLS